MDVIDVLVIGGGIIGLATATAVLDQRPGANVVVLEKESAVGTHQSGRNSGVIHTGLYYEPGSAKARLCTRGSTQMRQFCQEHGIEVERSGKVVIATDRDQVPALEALADRAAGNGVKIERIGPVGLADHEPHANGVAAIWVPGTSIVSFAQVTAAMGEKVEAGGGTILTDSEVIAISRRSGTAMVQTAAGLNLAATKVVNAAGLHVDRIAKLAGHTPNVRIIPFRGEYRLLLREARPLVRGLIYPVPDARLPFLGVHFTRMIHGGVEVGPNAVLSLAREGYRRSSVRPADAAETFGQAGFWRLAKQHWRTGMGEQWRSIVPRAFVADARRLVPSLELHHLGSFRAGVRAQAVDRRGNLVHDFAIEQHDGVVHVLNAPSPGATSALAIGDHVASLAVANI